jgi:hypothetical protein
MKKIQKSTLKSSLKHAHKTKKRKPMTTNSKQRKQEYDAKSKCAKKEIVF